MSEQLHRLTAFDASRKGYLRIVDEAAVAAGWRMLPYDKEDYALQDMETDIIPALAVVLDDFNGRGDFEGARLIEMATDRGIPHAVITDDTMQYMLEIATPNLYIPKGSGRIVDPLSSWLIALSAKS